MWRRPRSFAAAAKCQFPEFPEVQANVAKCFPEIPEVVQVGRGECGVALHKPF